MNKKIILKTTVLFLITFISTILISCGLNKNVELSKEQKQDENTENITNESITAYFVSENGYMVPLTYPVEGATKEDALKLAVERLIKGPKVEYLQGTVPESAKLKNWCLNNKIAYVDFTKEFLEIESRKEAADALESLRLTLGSFPIVDYIQLLVEGEVVDEIHGIDTRQPLKKGYENYFSENSEILQYTYKVYFADAYAVYMVPVTHRAETEHGNIKKAVENLLKGPELNGLTGTIWPGTELLNLSVEDGLATVDFSEDVIGYGGGTTAERLFVDSLLLTLGQFPEIDEVQILIEGEKVDMLPEGTAIDSPLTPPKYANFVDKNV